MSPISLQWLSSVPAAKLLSLPGGCTRFFEVAYLGLKYAQRLMQQRTALLAVGNSQRNGQK
jgi:hypothetical protein